MISCQAEFPETMDISKHHFNTAKHSLMTDSGIRSYQSYQMITSLLPALSPYLPVVPSLRIVFPAFA